MIEVYRPSGRFSPMIFVAALGLMAGAAAFGIVYQVIVNWIPFIFITWAATVFFMYALMVGMGAAVRLTRCRNLAVAMAVAVAVAGAGLVSAWWWAYTSTVNRMIAEADASPAEQAEFRRDFTFGEYVDYRAEQGWSISKDGGAEAPIRGVFVFLIWLAEAYIIIAGSVMGARAAAKKPYCESTDGWADTERMTITFPRPSESVLSKLREARTMDELLAIDVPPGPPETDTLVYTLHGRPDGEGSHFLTISLVAAAANKKGAVEHKVTDLWTAIVLPPEHAPTLQRLRDGAFSRERPGRAGADPA